MKKVLSIALFTAVFGLVGCSTQEKPDVTAQRDYNIAGATQRPKCKKGHKHHRHGKLGVETTEGDITK
jgi:hypothetical protein